MHCNASGSVREFKARRSGKVCRVPYLIHLRNIMSIKEIQTSDEFQQLIGQTSNEKLVVVDFYATWWYVLFFSLVTMADCKRLT